MTLSDPKPFGADHETGVLPMDQSFSLSWIPQCVCLFAGGQFHGAGTSAEMGSTDTLSGIVRFVWHSCYLVNPDDFKKREANHFSTPAWKINSVERDPCCLRRDVM
jgi:hypothetical protein